VQRSGYVTIEVRTFDDQLIPGAQVSAFLVSGERVALGLTSRAGQVELSRAYCERLGVQLILVCLEGFHCGAIPVSDPAERFYESRILHITLVEKAIWG
jgi:hypothetical protein